MIATPWAPLALAAGLSLAADLLAARRARPLSAALIALLALALWARAGAGVDLEAPGLRQGAPVTTTLTLQRPGDAPKLRQLPLSRPLPYGGLALLGLALTAALAAWGRRRPALAYGGLAVVALGVASLGRPRLGSGEAEVRAILSALSPAEAHLATFSVPAGVWRYTWPQAPALWAIAALALLLALSLTRLRLPAQPLRALSGALAAGAIAWGCAVNAPGLTHLGPAWIAALLLGVGALRPRLHPLLAPGAVGLLILLGAA
ncbi:hypothetical protein KKF91_06140 [Myxococcota bacterium]|nr:hypothetical protein [Myxococcota bacterium]MBU1430132.1 hypothetical protein [Myxococcota bacterium]MBU1896903.1 hypothetical protein [Myxococcota bacterium]